MHPCAPHFIPNTNTNQVANLTNKSKSNTMEQCWIIKGSARNKRVEYHRLSCERIITMSEAAGGRGWHRDDMIVYNEGVCQHQCVFVCYILCFVGWLWQWWWHQFHLSHTSLDHASVVSASLIVFFNHLHRISDESCSFEIPSCCLLITPAWRYSIFLTLDQVYDWI